LPWSRAGQLAVYDDDQATIGATDVPLHVNVNLLGLLSEKDGERLVARRPMIQLLGVCALAW